MRFDGCDGVCVWPIKWAWMKNDWLKQKSIRPPANKYYYRLNNINNK